MKFRALHGKLLLRAQEMVPGRVLLASEDGGVEHEQLRAMMMWVEDDPVGCLDELELRGLVWPAEDGRFRVQAEGGEEMAVLFGLDQAGQVTGVEYWWLPRRRVTAEAWVQSWNDRYGQRFGMRTLREKSSG